MSPLIYGIFALYLRYMKKAILAGKGSGEDSDIKQMSPFIFFTCLVLNGNPLKSSDSFMHLKEVLTRVPTDILSIGISTNGLSILPYTGNK